MTTLTELIKESLEGKLSDQIRASLKAEDSAENSDDNKSGESKPERYRILGTINYIDAYFFMTIRQQERHRVRGAALAVGGCIEFRSRNSALRCGSKCRGPCARCGASRRRG